MAMQRAPTEVVTLLNAFFAVVVEEVLRQHGVVNKFMGDGALCIFGATQEVEDPSGAALATARAIQRRLAEEVPDVRAGIGVSAGIVVAGNVGAADRFEYTVIGDPVNEASRLTELAKGVDAGICASEVAVHRAGPEERGRWALGEAVELRGRGRPTRVAVPT
jgi:adenylate cyclase